jgi:cytochrome-b5 reductase
VKKYPSGKSSTYLHSLERGQSVFFAFRLPGYTWVPNKFAHIILIAGGAGITPIYQLTQGILENPDDQTKITLLFAVNRDDDLVLKKELDDLEHNFPTRFRGVYTVSHPSEGSPYRKGRVTKALLQEILTDSQSKNPPVFLCGPPAMEESLAGKSGPFGAGKSGILQELGYGKDQIVRF